MGACLTNPPLTPNDWTRYDLLIVAPTPAEDWWIWWKLKVLMTVFALPTPSCGTAFDLFSSSPPLSTDPASKLHLGGFPVLCTINFDSSYLPRPCPPKFLALLVCPSWATSSMSTPMRPGTLSTVWPANTVYLEQISGDGIED